MTSVDWNALAHRALAAGLLHGLLPRAPRIVCRRTELSPDARGNVIVAMDAPALDAVSFQAARDALDEPNGFVAIVVASTAAKGLVQARLAPARAPSTTRTDAFARAAAWSSMAALGPIAEAVSVERVRALAACAAACGLSLVEADDPLFRVQGPRSAVDRAVLAIAAHGATARPLLFVPTARAPKGGLAKLRTERALDGWIAARSVSSASPASASPTPASASPTPASASPTPAAAASPPTSLYTAARRVLESAAAPMRGHELLREARAHCRAAASATDGPALANDLVAASVDGSIELYAVDPAKLLC